MASSWCPTSAGSARCSTTCAPGWPTSTAGPSWRRSRGRAVSSCPLEERLGSVGSLDDRRLLGDCTAAADLLGVEPVAVLGFCMGGMVEPEGRGHRALRPGRLVLRDDPAARARGGPPTMAEPLDVLGGAPDRHRSSTSAAPATRTCPVADLDDARGAGRRHRRPLPGGRPRLRPRRQPPRPPRRRRGRRLAPRGRLPRRLTPPAPTILRARQVSQTSGVSGRGGSAPRGW